MLFRRKAIMINLSSILKNKDMTLPTKVRRVKAMVFQESCVGVRAGQEKKVSAEEWMPFNCAAGGSVLRVL